jgi:hypothetical protein
MSETKKRSNVWLHFTELTDSKACCDIFKSELSVKGGNISNLTKHLKARHVSVVDGLGLGKKAKQT